MPTDPYSRLLAGMMPFHNRFRSIYATLQSTLRNPQAQALPKRDLEILLHQTLSLTHHLDGHHQIEEAWIFPHLAKRMPQFGNGKENGADDSHIAEHARTHTALEALQKYAESVESLLRGSQGRKAISDGAGKPAATTDQAPVPWPTAVFDSAKLHNLVDDLGATLFPHLEAEETSLRPSNLKAAGFTPEELTRIMI
ncbi:hypothetical protein V8E36_001296 [Tilletia maclaganii]